MRLPTLLPVGPLTHVLGGLMLGPTMSSGLRTRDPLPTLSLLPPTLVPHCWLPPLLPGGVDGKDHGGLAVSAWSLPREGCGPPGVPHVGRVLLRDSALCPWEVNQLSYLPDRLLGAGPGAQLGRLLRVGCGQRCSWLKEGPRGKGLLRGTELLGWRTLAAVSVPGEAMRPQGLAPSSCAGHTGGSSQQLTHPMTDLGPARPGCGSSGCWWEQNSGQPGASTGQALSSSLQPRPGL